MVYHDTVVNHRRGTSLIVPRGDRPPPRAEADVREESLTLSSRRFGRFCPLASTTTSTTDDRDDYSGGVPSGVRSGEEDTAATRQRRRPYPRTLGRRRDHGRATVLPGRQQHSDGIVARGRRHQRRDNWTKTPPPRRVSRGRRQHRDGVVAHGRRHRRDAIVARG